MQVASNEWFLGVQIQNFENLYNAERALVGTGYCCCDSVEECAQNIADLQGICVTDSCQPYTFSYTSKTVHAMVRALLTEPIN